MGYALFIDDDESLLDSVSRMAAREGLRIDTASSWDEGLATYHVTSPTLVVADYNMPGSKFGLQLLAEIRQTEPEVRLILISGYLDEEDRKAVTELGVADLALSKGPSDVQERLMDEIRTASHSDSEPSWGQVATAHLKARNISQESLDKLDRLLTKKAQR